MHVGESVRGRGEKEGVLRGEYDPSTLYKCMKIA
jgi:hypothetical protein